jgi:hypothetical protein
MDQRNRRAKKRRSPGMRSVMLLILLAAPLAAAAQSPVDAANAPVPAQFLAHPIFAASYSCSEHAWGELPYLGDDLGQDCVQQDFVEENGRAFMKSYRSDGLANEDWFGWNQPVLSPCDCKVIKTSLNPVTNTPGVVGTPPASMIVLEAADGTRLVLAHVQSLSVQDGEQVNAGQAIARVGNNGYSRMPHIHIGAWKDKQALQIRWDQRRISVL